ncbi:MAG: hypothetical protein CMA10_04735 [Euryarchaeota archaeon]|nr:hypothetical protein [Euryarchaeota archaeon]|tara:strand:- start:7107 stop:7775 length:669 start_codon:yes stop_codon:yes gene_type:complete
MVLPDSIALLTAGAGVVASACGWIATAVYTSAERRKATRTARYADALRGFYWPVYMRLVTITQAIQTGGSADADARALLRLITHKLGCAMPRRPMALPITSLAIKLAHGLAKNEPLRCIDVESLKQVTSVVKARLFQLQREYDNLTGDHTTKELAELYQVAIEAYPHTDTMSGDPCEPCQGEPLFLLPNFGLRRTVEEVALESEKKRFEFIEREHFEGPGTV